MRKSALFISAALTAFMIAVLFGVVSAYQKMSGSTQVADAATAQVVPTAAELAAVAPTMAAVLPANITPEQATSIASMALNRTDLYSVEVTPFNGADAYLVTFSSGDLVYVNMSGQIVSISKLPVTVVQGPKRRVKYTDAGNGGGGGGGGEGGGEHEGGGD